MRLPTRPRVRIRLPPPVSHLRTSFLDQAAKFFIAHRASGPGRSGSAEALSPIIALEAAGARGPCPLIRSAQDSALEEAGFEPSVPLLRPVLLRTSAPAFRITAPENSRVQEIEPPSRRWPPSRDRWFGSKPVELDAGLANRGNSRTGDRDLFPARTNPGFVKRRFALHTRYRVGERGPGIHAAVENRAAPFPGGSNRLHDS